MTKHVDIRQAGRALAVPAGVTILDAALADGIAYPHGCRSGRCGSCKSRLVSGEVDLLEHSRFALSNEERAQGLILACRAIPTTDAVVTWLGDNEEHPSHPHRRLNCSVIAIEDVTDDIKYIRLAINGADPLIFTAGQYTRLTFRGAPARDYSMASGPGERSHSTSAECRAEPRPSTSTRCCSSAIRCWSKGHSALPICGSSILDRSYASPAAQALRRSKRLSRRQWHAA